MKKLTILTIFLISAGLFTGCKKDDATTVSPNYSSTIDYNLNTAITYKLTMQRPSGDPMTGGNPLMNWDNGYIHVSGLIFNVIYAGGPVQSDKFGMQTDKTMQAFETNVLGAVKVPVIKPSTASFTIETAPTETEHALVLEGVYYHTADMPHDPPLHVQFIVDEQVSINTQWLNEFTTINGSSACMTLDMAQLANGLNRTIMDNATVTNDVIVISSTSNPNIYRVMVNNLRTMMMDVKYLTPAAATASPAVE